MEQPQTAEEDTEVSSEKCYICLGPFEEQAVGSLENCQHEFCLECIVQWSKTANTCPVDRTTFTIIHQRRQARGTIQKKIKVTPPKCIEELEEERLAVICENCGRSDRRTRMLLCSHCDSGFHMNCLRPAVSERPQGSWVCPECEVTLNQPDGFAAEEGISDGELEDILSEADETSSRLRPSTLNNSGSGSTRHSERVQTRSNRDPTAPLSITRVPKYLLQVSSSNTTTDTIPTASTSATDEPRKRRRT
ncbi:PHD and RING finger domain-containing protein 1-like [Periophthalmus magnuspinnatus]|uniref:PHD and RING finger domain-containing protein 1-like n=1 Tax=Periophthalmus magnuspinnatus TaxID=409849 RepID=UPI00145B9B22|nr:PHD and RING finger domain-containing protein 1-like [Periophthalmus magnuspinnatus]